MAEAKTKAGTDIDKLEADFAADPGNFVILAQAYLERSLPLQAIQVCKRGLKANPSAEEGLLALGMAYFHNYDNQRAEIALKKAIRSSPENAVAHRTLAEIFLDRGQDQKALSELMRSIEIEPRDAHTRALLTSLEEKLPPLDRTDGYPQSRWVPRHSVIPGDAPKPLWQTVLQILVVAAVVAATLVWYNHYVDIRVQVRAHLEQADEVIPQDNFDDLLAAEQSLVAALALDDGEEKAIVRQAAVQTSLWRDHKQNDRKDRVKALLKWMEDEDLPNAERFAVKALMMVDAGKAADAETFLEEIIKRGIDKKDIFLNAMIFGARGEARMQLGKVKEAREDFSRAVRFSGESAEYHAKFAEVYLREGNLPRAIKYFRDAVRKNPGHVYSNLRLAYAIVQTGKRLDEALKMLNDFLDEAKHPAAEFSPRLKGLLNLVRAEYALATENVPEAHTWLKKSLEVYEASAEAHNLAGRLATLNKDGAKAANEFARAIALDARLPRVYFDRSESMFQLGQKTEAVNKLKDFERYLKPTVAYHIQRGSLLMRMDDMQAALNEFQNGIKVDELSPDARFHVALCYQKMGEKVGDAKERKEEKLSLYNQARTEYENTVILPGGERSDVYHMMGRIYLDSEDPDNALDKLGKSVLMMQKAGEPSARIAVVYEDIARVFKYLGGTEGERQEKVYRAKAEALRKGMTIEAVEQAWAEKAKKEKKSKRRRRRRRGRSR